MSPKRDFKGALFMTDKILDFTSKRNENIEEKRRNFERILFQNFLGAYSVLDEAGAVHPITLVDISKDGCLFQIPWNMSSDKKYTEGHELNLRMYFTKDTYVPTIVNIKYSSEFLENGQSYMRYGCEFDKSVPSFQAMQSFIDFLYKFAEHSSCDKGQKIVHYF